MSKIKLPENGLFGLGGSDDKKHDDTQPSQHVNIQTEEGKAKGPVLKRQTYYLDDQLIEALRRYAFNEREDKSKVVRDALKTFIPAEYFEQK